MKTYTILYKFLFIVLTFFINFTYAQNNSDKIKARWVIDSLAIEKNTTQAIQARQNVPGTYLTFGDELLISKKDIEAEHVIKQGPYSISANSITFGKDQAEIIELSEQLLTIKIPGQGILYLRKME